MSSANDTFLTLAPAVSAIASAVAAIVAAVNVWMTNRNARRTRAVDLLMKKEAEFESERMHKKRSAAAIALLGKVQDSTDVFFVLDFMESVCGLALEDDLNAVHVWHTFYHWFSHYYYACDPYLRKEQGRDPAVWKCIRKLHTELEKVQRKQGGTPFANNTPSSLATFLKAEADLVSDSAPKVLDRS